MRNFSSILRLKNGKSDTGGRRMSVTREVTTAANALPILQRGCCHKKEKRIGGFFIHQTNCYFKYIVS